MNARLAKTGVAGTAEHRRAYREMLVTTPHLGEGVSGVILCDETFRQALADSQPFPQGFADCGLLPGIKVDTGPRPLAGAPGEKVTEGLDGLPERLAEYVRLGARFAKWRAVFVITDGNPSWRGRAREHARPHPLRGDLPRGGLGADCRGRSADGRRAFGQEMRRRHGGVAARLVR